MKFFFFDQELNLYKIGESEEDKRSTILNKN